jgi:hypothetical protein
MNQAMPEVEDLSPRARFAALVADLSTRPRVTVSTNPGFGQGGLMADGKLFALLRGEELLLKLPAPTVAHLIVQGEASSFDAGKGRPMKEWATVPSTSRANWTALAREACDFVSGPKVTARKR